MNVQKILPTLNNLAKTEVYQFPTKNLSLTKTSAKHLPAPIIKEISSVFENYIVHISHSQGTIPRARVRIFDKNTSFDDILRHKKALVEVNTEYSCLLGTLQEALKKTDFVETYKKELNNLDDDIIKRLTPHELKRAIGISQGYKIKYKPVFFRPICNEGSEVHISSHGRNNFSDPYLVKGKSIELSDIKKAINDFVRVKTPLA